MRFRKLRIAWSVGCAIACVLLIALWVRSYWWIDTLHLRSVNAKFGSFNGGFEVGKLDGLDRAVMADGKNFYCTSAEEVREEMRQHGIPINFFSTIFDFYLRNNKIGMPYWLPLLLFTTLATAPWFAQFSWRFSLRTLLIATTLVAVSLGLIVWTMK